MKVQITQADIDLARALASGASPLVDTSSPLELAIDRSLDTAYPGASSRVHPGDEVAELIVEFEGIGPLSFDLPTEARAWALAYRGGGAVAPVTFEVHVSDEVAE